MFERVLFPTDFSEVSLRAVDYLARLKEAGARHVTVLHVVDPQGALPWMVRDVQEAAQREAEDVALRLRELGLDATVAIELGDPADEILRLAESGDASLIVIGSHGKGHVAELVLGSVSDDVIRKAARPVLVVKPWRSESVSPQEPADR